MADESTPQPVHDIPSLPASPDPKRTRFTDPAPNLSVASILNDSQPTPTPGNAGLPHSFPMMSSNIPNIPSLPGPNQLPSMHGIPPMPAMQPMSFEPPPPALQVKLLSPDARPPTRSSAFAAGYDVYASRAATVPAWGKVLADTDISIAVPASTYGRVAPRSGLASKHSIHTGAGVIDADYRGPVKVLLFNLSGTEFKVEAGDRIAQLIVERIYTPEVVVVDQLEETVRGAGGFGSTGGFGGTLPSFNGMAGT